MDVPLYLLMSDDIWVVDLWTNNWVTQQNKVIAILYTAGQNVLVPFLFFSSKIVNLLQVHSTEDELCSGGFQSKKK